MVAMVLAGRTSHLLLALSGKGQSLARHSAAQALGVVEDPDEARMLGTFFSKYGRLTDRLGQKLSEKGNDAAFDFRRLDRIMRCYEVGKGS